MKEGVPKNNAKLRRSFFFKKVTCCRPITLLKKDSDTNVFL